MKRRRNRRPKWGWKTVFVCAGILCLSALPFLAGKLPVAKMKIRQLTVMGLNSIPSVDFHEFLGIEKGGPLLGQWLERSAQIASANPRVGNVTVSRSMTGEVQVHVRERKAQALLNLDRLYYIDGDGNVLGAAKYDSPEAMDLPVITGIKAESKDKLRAAIRLKSALLVSGQSESSISELHYDALKGWVLFRTGISASFVMGEDHFETKATRLKRVLRDFQGREQTLAEVDLDFDDRVIVKKAAVNNTKGSRHGKEG